MNGLLKMASKSRKTALSSKRLITHVILLTGCKNLDNKPNGTLDWKLEKEDWVTKNKEKNDLGEIGPTTSG